LTNLSSNGILSKWITGKNENVPYVPNVAKGQLVVMLLNLRQFALVVWSK
jgi:hypothetical protein